MVAGGRPLSPPPRTDLSAVMSSTGKHSQLCSPSQGTLPDERRRALSRTFLSRPLQRTNKRACGLFLSVFVRVNSHSDDRTSQSSPGRGDVLLFPWQPEEQTHQCTQVRAAQRVCRSITPMCLRRQTWLDDAGGCRVTTKKQNQQRHETNTLELQRGSASGF